MSSKGTNYDINIDFSRIRKGESPSYRAGQSSYSRRKKLSFIACKDRQNESPGNKHHLTRGSNKIDLAQPQMSVHDGPVSLSSLSNKNPGSLITEIQSALVNNGVNVRKLGPYQLACDKKTLVELKQVDGRQKRCVMLIWQEKLDEEHEELVTGLIYDNVVLLTE